MKGVKLLERSVVVNMPLKQWNSYKPHHQGIRFALIGHNRKKDQFAMSLFGSTHNPNSNDDITKRDLNEELARLPIIDERLRTRIFGKKKVQHIYDEHKEKMAMLTFKGLPFSQGFTGEWDYINSRMTNKYEKWIPKKEFKEVKKHNKNVEGIKERKDKFGRKEVLTVHGNLVRL